MKPVRRDGTAPAPAVSRQDIVDLLRARMTERGMNYAALDAKVGTVSGFNNVVAKGRNYSVESLLRWAAALELDIYVVPRGEVTRFERFRKRRGPVEPLPQTPPAS